MQPCLAGRSSHAAPLVLPRLSPSPDSDNTPLAELSGLRPNARHLFALIPQLTGQTPVR